MSIDPLTQAMTAEPLAPAQDSLGKDDFMRLLVTQLENQDPLQPMDNTQFVAQLAQFSSLEQLVNVSDGLSMLQLAQMSMSNVQAATLVGKTITAEGNGFFYEGSGDHEIPFEIGSEADTVSVSIVDEAGGHVRTLELGRHEAGQVTVAWDGLNASGIRAAPGQYQLEVEALDAEGNPVDVRTQLEGNVTGIFFDRGYAELEVNGNRVRLGDLVSVVEPSSSEAADDEGR